jgi:hypothetical protein
MTHTTFDTVTARIGQLDWPQLMRQLDEQGFAVTDAVLSADECVELAKLFDGDGFRSLTAGPICSQARTRRSR